MMKYSLKPAIAILLGCTLLLTSQTSMAGWQFTGRAAFSHNTAIASPGDAGYISKDEDTVYNDIQSLRFMQDAHFGQHEFSAHYRLVRTHASDLTPTTQHFRYTPLDHHFIHQNNKLDWRQELDYLHWRINFKQMRFSLGRQAISLSNGRLWQPLDIFGSFDAVELDREYKSGIDGAVVSWFPGSFSEVSLYTIISDPDINKSINYAIRGQHQFKQGLVAILQYGRTLDIQTAGFSIETIMLDQAVRFETLFTNTNDTNSVFASLGTERQLEDNTMVTLELYANSLGSWESSGYYDEDRLIRQASGLQNHLGKYLGALSFSDQITPLMSGSYLLMLNPADDNGTTRYSWLHQVSMNYSLGNETAAQVSVMTGYGKGLEDDLPASEFGHVPFNVSIRIHSYF